MQNGKMSPERWERVKSVVQAALECEANQRAEYLAATCADDPALRAEVESLIAYELGNSDFIEAPAFAPAGQALPLTGDPALAAIGDLTREFEPGERAGQQIGPYRVVRALGKGGMGAVYLAERADDEYRKRVAIKLIKRGMDSEFVLRRFRTERQILAALDHPNIARLHDGGTSEDGLPYLVMEYIEGIPLDEYCEQHKLTTAERLQLFRQVCAAVHYAHQHLVIHRDLKPSNILVTPDGTPKLLDFGIAKLLTPELAAETLDQTQGGLRLMTPAYASPEQVRGEPITTASDVYALGVVLYELLTGHSPYRLRENTQQEIMRAVCEQEPERPSTTAERMKDEGGRMKRRPAFFHLSSFIFHPSALSGDLDNIVLMALRKEPLRRYASVEQFSEDIRRHLEGRPVSARKDTLGYRTTKFVKRNKVGVTAAVLILLTLVTGIVMTVRARAQAERRFNEVRKLARSVMFDYHDAIAELPGSTPVRQRLVNDALQYLDSLAAEAAGDVSLQRELAAAYRKIGDVQGNPYVGNLGNTQGAIASYRKSLAIREALAARDNRPEALREVANSLAGLGDVLWEVDDLQGASSSYRRAVEILTSLAAAAPNDLDLRRELARAHGLLGDIQGHPYFANLGDTASALDNHRRALALRESLVATEPNNVEFRRALFMSHYAMGYMLRGTGALREAEQSLRQALEISRPLAAADPNNARARRNVNIQLQLLGDVIRDQGRLPEAIATYRESQALSEAAVAADPKSAQAKRDVGITYNRLAKVLVKTGDFPAAIQVSLKALAPDETAYAANPTSGVARRDLAISYDTHGDILLESGKTAEALQYFGKALALREGYLREHPDDTTTLPGLIDSYERLGEAQAKMRDVQAALTSFRKARAAGEKFLGLDPKRDRIRDSLATVCYKLGKQAVLAATQSARPRQAEHWREAQSAYRRSLELFAELQQKGGLQAVDAGKPDELARELARCEAALAQSR